MLFKPRLFASFREAVGATSIEIEVGQRLTVRDLLVALRERYPALGPTLGSALVAVNLEYVGPDFTLSEGDEIALIPPVSGGELP